MLIYALLTWAVPAIAGNFDNVLIYRVPTMVAAIFRISACGTTAHFVSAFTFICHNLPPSYGIKIRCITTYLIIVKREGIDNRIQEYVVDGSGLVVSS
jgi:hypothetical protein